MKIYWKHTPYAAVAIAQNRIVKATNPEGWLKMERILLYLDTQTNFESTHAFARCYPSMVWPGNQVKAQVRKRNSARLKIAA